MKSLFFTIILLVSLFQYVAADGLSDDKKTESSIHENRMLEILGYMTVYRSGLKELGFNANDAEAIARGLKKALSDETMDVSIQKDLADFQSYIEVRLSQAEAKMAREQASSASDNIAAGKAYIDELKAKKNLTTTDSGLHYEIHEAGSDVLPSLEDTVTVHYKGTRIDGTQFDSSYDRGMPADFPLKGVVPGFAEGLTKIGEGGRITLYIPSDLAYGNNPRPGVIQPGDTLIFDCELIKVNP